MSNNDTDILLEDIDDKLKAILEGQAAMAGVPASLQRIEERLTRVEEDGKTTKAAVTDLSRETHHNSEELKDHEVRIATLE
jgi:uncharacterized protein YoxC